MREVTWKEWLAKHPDFKTRINGAPHMMRLDPETGATVLEPVRILDGPGGLARSDGHVTWTFPDLAKEN